MTPPTIAYCTNIHPASGLGAVTRALADTGAAVRRRAAPGSTLPVGLRLSADEAEALDTPHALDRFTGALGDAGLAVACINGFAFGVFHSGRVKDAVHTPDWRDDRRATYTERLGSILARLLPEAGAGGVSTAPLSYRPWGEPDADSRALMTRNIARVAARFARLRDDTGRTVHLDLEPEPDGLIETVGEFAAWFERELLPATSAIGLNHERAPRHVRVCLDACHLAVMGERAGAALDALDRVGARVGRVQASSAIRVAVPEALAGRGAVREALAPFAESTYLHQTVASCAGRVVERWPDLPDALVALDAARAAEWRVHYHVPIFWPGAGVIATTRDDLLELAREVRRRDAGALFEVETYTWTVLPEELRLDLPESIAREIAWLRDALAATDASEGAGEGSGA